VSPAAAAPESSWPLPTVLRKKQPLVITDPMDCARRALILPIRAPAHEHLAGSLVSGIRQRRPWDDGYRAFFDLVAGQLATAISDARAYEKQRQRAEA